MQRRRFQQVLESTIFRSIARLLERNNTRHVGPAGGAFANARLNRLLSDKLRTDEIFIYQATGDDGRPTGGALCYLLQQYISSAIVIHYVCYFYLQRRIAQLQAGSEIAPFGKW